MYQPERFQVDITEPISSYRYVGPYESTVSYHYPHRIVTSFYDRNDAVLSETSAIRRELSAIRSDIGDIKRHQVYPTYYVAKEYNSNEGCPICASSSSGNQQHEHVQNPVYYYDEYPTFVEERPHTVGGTVRSKAPITTYQDHYRGPSQYGSSGQTKRRTTLNELQTQSPSSSSVQHPRHWIPTSSKNSYPHRRWNLSVPHSEP
jgi:hypothetical protein